MLGGVADDRDDDDRDEELGQVRGVGEGGEPMKNSLSPSDSAASEIELTRISDMTPTATPAMPSAMTDLRTVHGSP